MEAHDVRAALDQSPIWTTEDGTASVYVVEGEIDVIVLTDERPVETTVRAGSIFVVPRAGWHRQIARAGVMQLGLTTGRTEHSNAEYPGSES